MKKEQPDLFRDPAAENHSTFDDDMSTDLKVPISKDLCKAIHPRPSLIPGVEYPLTPRAEHLLDLAWDHAIRYKISGGHYDRCSG